MMILLGGYIFSEEEIKRVALPIIGGRVYFMIKAPLTAEKF